MASLTHVFNSAATIVLAATMAAIPPSSTRRAHERERSEKLQESLNGPKENGKPNQGLPSKEEMLRSLTDTSQLPKDRDGNINWVATGQQRGLLHSDFNGGSDAAGMAIAKEVLGPGENRPVRSAPYGRVNTRHNGATETKNTETSPKHKGGIIKTENAGSPAAVKFTTAPASTTKIEGNMRAGSNLPVKKPESIFNYVSSSFNSSANAPDQKAMKDNTVRPGIEDGEERTSLPKTPPVAPSPFLR